MTVSIETAALAGLLMFLLGFFGNLLAMRKMFVSKPEFVLYAQSQLAIWIQHDKDFTEYKLSRVHIWEEHERARIEFREYIDKICEGKRAGCAPLKSSLDDISKDVNELFKLLRVTHGRLERVIGKLENNAKCYWPQEAEEG
ncbi:MAG: hypothetical protein V2B18_21260 [Pseudomonadota bacterium]